MSVTQVIDALDCFAQDNSPLQTKTELITILKQAIQTTLTNSSFR